MAKKRRNGKIRRKSHPGGLAKRLAAQRPSRSEGDVHSVAYAGYHQVLFAYIGGAAQSGLDLAVWQVREGRRRFWRDWAGRGVMTGTGAWVRLRDYMATIEEWMQSIICRHSYYYWVHMYRRIRLGLHPMLDNKRDPRTIALVREIVEVALGRYGQLGGDRIDIAPASSLKASEIAGGILELACESLGCPDVVEAVRASGQFVLKDFAIEDYVGIHHIEVLAYEYWLVTARMRRVGKGGGVYVDIHGDLQSSDTGGDGFERRLELFDARTEYGELEASSIGLAFLGGREVQGGLHCMIAGYNRNMLPWDDVVRGMPLGIEVGPGFCPNYILTVVDLDTFVKAHSVVAEAYQAKYGFNIEALVGVMAAASQLCVGTALDKADKVARNGRWINLFQRAYVKIASATFYDSVKALALKCAELCATCNNIPSLDSIDGAIRALTLTSANQNGVGLWSRGPRYLFTEVAGGVMIDLSAIPANIRFALVGVRADSRKGPEFEDQFRSLASASGLDVLANRLLVSRDMETREVDAAIRVRDTLFLCECRSMEEPLDLELSKPDKLAKRNVDLGEKVMQAKSLAEFVDRNRSGRNYDFSWARDVVHMVISPFCEWTWSDGSEYWLNASTPRILSAREAVDYMSLQLPTKVES